MKTSIGGINIIKKHEGCKLEAYQDSVGVWTIGYGQTGFALGKKIQKGLKITQVQADFLLMHNIIPFENAINKLVKVKLKQNQFDALVDFVYNIGINAFSKSTLLKLLNQGKYKEAADQFLMWNKPKELIKRRQEEKALFLL